MSQGGSFRSEKFSLNVNNATYAKDVVEPLSVELLRNPVREVMETETLHGVCVGLWAETAAPVKRS